MKVSICTPVFNQSEFLRRNIESVRAQTCRDWEHIIVDDGSTEDIKALVESYDDARLVYVRFPENKGIPHGLNYALSIASGEYVQPLAADEFIWERKLEVQVAWMDDHPGIGCTWGLPTPNIGKAWELGGPRPEWEMYQQKAHNRSREAWLRTLIQLDHVPIGGGAMLMRRECYKAIGGFDPAFFATSDLEWFIRFFRKYQGWVLPYRFADASHTPSSQSAKSTPDSFASEMDLVRDTHRLVLPPVKGRVTIGIPVRNMEKYVAKSIQSVLDQTFTDFDLVVLDDASTDGTLAEIQKFTDPRITLLQFDENRGVAAANNHILGGCGTPFYVPFSADDVLDPTFLARCLHQFQSDPYLEFVASQTDFIDVDGKPVTKHPMLNIQKAANKPREQWLHQLYYGNQYFGAGMYRTGTLLDIGGWDETVGVICDYDVYLKLLQRENLFVIEENLTHTRIHDGQQSMLRGREAMTKLRQDYHIVKSRYYPPRMKVIIATPFYEMRGFSPYISSMVQTVQGLSRMGIEHEFWELSGDSYVDRAKNTLFNKFLEDPAATDLFMIDSDMQWNPQAFIDMLMFPEDIVQGSYPQKNAWDTWTARPLLVEKDGRLEPVGRFLANGSALIKAEYLAGGFLRVKRGCLEKYRDAYKDYVYHDSGADPSYPERLYTEFFTCERAKNEAGLSLRWGEDRVFGRRMAAIGVESWIYPNIDFGHYGIKGWMGNYDKHLRAPPTAEEKAA